MWSRQSLQGRTFSDIRPTSKHRPPQEALPMPQVPTKVAARLSAAVKRFQPIIASAKSRDANESDTVIIVTDMLSEVFGYDKYSEITSECSIRGTWCDLAIKINGTFEYLIEVKAIGLDLKDSRSQAR